MTTITTRRGIAAPVLVAAAVGGLAPRARAAEGSEDVSATEDLMREHGVLRRTLIVFAETAPRVRANPEAVDAAALAEAAALFRAFGEDYHERSLEEQFVFPDVVRGGGAPARLIGGRLAIQLGAPKLGRRMHLLAFRATPAHFEAIYYHARYRMERFGPLSTWRFMREHPDWSDAGPEMHADWISLSAFIIARVASSAVTFTSST